MRKIDLHIHTVSTISDANFNFDLSLMKRYVEESKIDAIAITNHNIFDAEQYRTIRDALDTTVLPGIEVDLEGGHVLVIADDSLLEQFQRETTLISGMISQPTDHVSLDQFSSAFPNLESYLVIPHYDKKPAIKGETLGKLAGVVTAGEVDSAKKFIRTAKDDKKLTPVLFSDSRMSSELDPFPIRHTYVNCGEITLSALKLCLRDKSKVALSRNDGNSLVQIFADGQMISTGLNVLLGERSTGKTVTLNGINEVTDNVKYIRQFDLVQHEDEASDRQFDDDLKKQRSQFVEDYLAEFRNVVGDIMKIDLQSDGRAVEQYADSVLKAAEEADKRDAFSKTVLFDETEFPIKDDKALYSLIKAVRHLIENVEYRDVIDRHVDIGDLQALIVELIEVLREKELDKKKKKWINELVENIKEGLKMRTSAVQVDDVDLYCVAMNKRKVERFEKIVKCVQSEATIAKETVQDFSVIARKEPFAGAGEIKKTSGVKTAFQDAFKKYNHPYEYLEMLLSNESLTRSDLYKLFTKISYKVLNRDGNEVSGGERSEFRLLQQIKDAQNYDMLLIDEPESSFDNVFLRRSVNQIIRDIANSMPVIVVTHNSTVGASVGADYLMYASKEYADGEIIYRIYSGYPTDRKLRTVEGEEIETHRVLLSALEAGNEAYEGRRRHYEGLKSL